MAKTKKALVEKAARKPARKNIIKAVIKQSVEPLPRVITHAEKFSKKDSYRRK
jgi:hypothetical protein